MSITNETIGKRMQDTMGKVRYCKECGKRIAFLNRSDFCKPSCKEAWQKRKDKGYTRKYKAQRMAKDTAQEIGDNANNLKGGE